MGSKRFSDIQRDYMGIGPAVLTQRLHDLEPAESFIDVGCPGRGAPTSTNSPSWGSGLEAVNTPPSLWTVASSAVPLEADMSPDTGGPSDARTHGRSSGARTSDVLRSASRIPGSRMPRR